MVKRNRTAPRQVGSEKETDAMRYLGGQGLTFRERNFLCRMGEIDLIMLDGPVLVFVEVRWRRRSDFGNPAETVNLEKQRKLVRCASLYLQRRYGAQPPPCRFDVLGIAGDGAHARFQWIRNAFSR